MCLMFRATFHVLRASQCTFYFINKNRNRCYNQMLNRNRLRTVACAKRDKHGAKVNVLRYYINMIRNKQLRQHDAD